MAAKKDFAGLNTSRVSSAIEQATGKRKQQATASPQEAAERAEQLRTQGRKGCAATRINMAFSTQNIEFIKVMSKFKGMTLTAFTNYCLDKYREEHAELYEQAKGISEKF